MQQGRQACCKFRAACTHSNNQKVASDAAHRRHGRSPQKQKHQCCLQSGKATPCSGGQRFPTRYYPVPVAGDRLGEVTPASPITLKGTVSSEDIKTMCAGIRMVRRCVQATHQQPTTSRLILRSSLKRETASAVQPRQHR